MRIDGRRYQADSDLARAHRASFLILFVSFDRLPASEW